MQKIRKKRLKNQYHMKSSKELDTILDAIHDDILIADSQGKIIKVSKSFEKVYGIAEEDIIGKTVYEMEKKGVFKPSIVAQVLETKQKVTMRQKTNLGRELVVTATPINNRNGEISKVVSFTRDLTDFMTLQQQYLKLESKIEKYTAEIEELRRNVVTVEGIVGNSHAIQQVIKTINRIAKFDVNVLLLGPSGVGKTTFSRILHKKSNRSSGPFIEINCAAIPDNLLESELFGYERGSFTGAANEGKTGLIELAQGGTLMLDEISELPISLQAKILKVIQDKIITRVGGTKEIKVDFRLITASNKDIEELILQNKFRQDIYYRLNVVTINIPSLKERKEDILPLANYFIEKFNEKYKLNKALHPQTMNFMLRYDWPGNVRELENTIECATIISEENIITQDALSENISQPPKQGVLNKKWGSLEEAMEKYEAMIVKETFKEHNTTVALAKELQISQPTAFRKIKKYIDKG